jgi:hypothetical protein
MPEPAPAKFGGASSINVSITFANSDYGVTPQASSVENDGQVYFISARACWLWTEINGTLTDAFEGETGNYLPCNAGNNGPYTPAEDDVVITIIPTAPNSNPPSSNPAGAVKGTITVGSVSEPRQGGHRP